MTNMLGGGGSTSLFLDADARHDFGGGWRTELMARRGWTSFAAGKFESGGYSFDVGKLGVLASTDRVGLRIAQPLRVEHGGFAMMLPTSYDYVTLTAGKSLSTMSLTPSGREIDTELSYGSSLLGDRAWIGGNLFYRRQPGHIAAADGDLGAAIRFSLGF